MLEDAIKELDDVMKTTVDTGDRPEVVEMNPEDFVRHMTKNIVALKTDAPATASARVAYLSECLGIAKAAIAKNFEGPTPGKMSVPGFKDPGQLSTTETSGALGGPAGAAPASAPASHGMDQQAATIPTPPTGSTTATPPAAGPSGAPFADPGGNFAKSLDGVMKSLQEVLATLRAPTAAAPPAAETKTETDVSKSVETKTETDEEKAKRVAREKALARVAPVDFPSDMAAEALEIDEETHFGFDKGSLLEKRWLEEQAAKAKAETQTAAE